MPLNKRHCPEFSLPADVSLLRGYDETFLQAATIGSKSSDAQSGGIAIPLPKLTEPAPANAYEGGRRIDYANFSIVFEQGKAGALLCRGQSATLRDCSVSSGKRPIPI